MKYVCSLFCLLLFLNNMSHAQSSGAFNYGEAWKKVEQLSTTSNLPKSALAEVEKIYTAALAAQNYPQLLKAIRYRVGLLCQTTGNWNASINSLKQEEAKLPFPAQAIVQSFLAEAYLSYYESNYFQFAANNVLSAPSDDLATWDSNTLTAEVLRSIRLALSNAKGLQAIPTSEYEPVLEGEKETVALRPSLYDFLISRMITTLSRQEPNSVKLGQLVFTYNNEAYFSDVRTFVQVELASTDTLSFSYHALKLTQEQLAFRLIQKEQAPLLDADLNRLKLVYSQSKLDNKDELYEQALVRLVKDAGDASMAGDIKYELAVFYYKQGESFRNTGQYRNRIMDALALCNEIEAKHKQSLAYKNKEYAKALRDKILGSSVSITLDNYTLPDEASKVLLTYRNVDVVSLSIVRLENDFTDDDESLRKTWKTMWKGQKKVQQQDIKTSRLPDYQSYSAEVAIQPLPIGRYMLVASNRKDATEKDAVVEIKKFQVTDLTIITSSDPVLYLRHRKSGKAIANATVNMYSLENKNKNLLTTFTTNAEGEGHIEGKNRDKIHRIGGLEITTKDGRTQYFNMNWYYWNRKKEAERESQTILFFTDRTIYRPGQTLYFKGLMSTNKPAGSTPEVVTDKKVKVRLFDVNGQEAAVLDLVTNEYGSIQGSFVLPQGGLNGQMSLRTDYGSHYFSVEEYKRPTFEVTLKELEQEVALGSEVQVEGLAKTFAGYATDEAKVQYRVLRRAEPMFRRWFLPNFRTAEREIASGETTTDAVGAFNIPFTAKADDLGNDDLVYNYIVTADVTDRTGETHSASYTIRAARKPLLIEAAIPDQIEAGDKLLFDLKTINLNGQAVPCEVKVTVSQLQSPSKVTRKSAWAVPDTFILTREEFERLLPYDQYTGDENRPDKFRVLKELPSIKLNTSQVKQLDLSLLNTMPSAWYAIRMEATSEKGVSVERAYYVQLINGEPAEIIQAEDWLQVVTAKAEPGGEAVFWLAGATDHSMIQYTLYGKDRKVIEKRVMEVGRKPMKLAIPIREEYRGGVSAQFSMVQNNRFYQETAQIQVPWSNKKLDVEWRSFRDQLLPGQSEKWSLVIRDSKHEPALAELVATLYDASLDAFRPYSWKELEEQIYRQQFDTPLLSDHSRSVYMGGLTMVPYYGYSFLSRDYIHFVPSWGYGLLEETVMMGYGRTKGGLLGRVVIRGTKNESAVPMAAMAKQAMVVQREMSVADNAMDAESGTTGAGADVPLEAIVPRTNFDETAFFYPNLYTNDKGEVEVEFVIPQSLTRWKMMGFAHTKDLKVGTTERTLVTRKEVAVTAHAPRFLRHGDTIVLTARVNNSAEKDLQATVQLQLFDAVSGNEVAGMIQSKASQQIDLPKDQSGVVAWKLFVPSNLQALTYRVSAKAEQHTDGEERTLPVLPNSMLVTETMPFMVRGGEEKSFTFDRLKNQSSPTLKNHALTLEFTSNPAWYAIQALPYLMEYPYDCSEQIFSRYFANSLASQVSKSSPKVKQIFDLWQSNPDGKTLLSNLEKNQELKQALLEETPWVLEAKDQRERKKRVGLLFDLNRMGQEQQKAITELSKKQKSNGAFPWFEGMDGSRFITQHIVIGLSQLQRLGAIDAKSNEQVATIIQSGLAYCDAEIAKAYGQLEREPKVDLTKQHVGVADLHYLYACSFGNHVPADRKQAKAQQYYADQAARYWSSFGTYEQGLIALWAHRSGKSGLAQDIVKSLREYAQQSDQMGMYWNRRNNQRGYFWYEAPIETHALMIEVFQEVAKDPKSVEELKVWLLLNKQTSDWKSTKATAAACYALLMTGDNLLGETRLLEVKVNGKNPVSNAEATQEAGTGYVKTSWSGAEVTPKMAVLEVKNPNKGLAWGAMYWQYFEQLDKITSAETNLKINRRLFIKTTTENGPVLVPIDAEHPLKVGDLVTVRMELRADRDFEYVHLKDARASGFEPVSTLSGYHYTTGLGYYQNIKDASMNFFFDYLRKGTYVFEYDLRVAHQGDFSNGVSTFQCMYAPEFAAHSEGIRVNVQQ